jgi:NADPH:quinone reductase-like Zn-dependent oxidoreductase
VIFRAIDMKAAIVTGAGRAPIYADFESPQAAPGEVLIDITAAALSHVTKARAAGTHYSSAGVYPFVVGLDGVGRRQDGKRVFFLLPRAPFGGMAERTVVNASHCIAVPDQLDDVTAAAIANPGMSSWAALKERARLLPGENVLVNGATGSSGRLAVQIAQHLGAKKIVATGRDSGVLNSLAALGADVAISLLQDGDALDAAFSEQFAGDGVDIVLDYLWGPSAERLLGAAAKSGKDGVPIRFVQIGSIGGQTIPLAATVIRSSSLQLIGSGIGSVPFGRMCNAIAELFQATVANRFKLATKAVPLADVANHWARNNATIRTVFVTGGGAERTSAG